MIQKILLPKLGQTMEKATIERWHKKEGDPVKKGEVVLEITTDKATLEVESYVRGVLLKRLVNEGEEVEVNRVIALVGQKGDTLPEDLSSILGEEAPPVEKEEEKAGAVAATPQASPPASSAAPTAEQPSAPAPEPAPAGPEPTGRLFASPRARKLAKDEKVRLEWIHGTGEGGRIVEKDVREYVEKAKDRKITPVAWNLAYEQGTDLLSLRPPATGEITKQEVLQQAVQTPSPAAPTPGAVPTAPGAERPLSAMRRVIADRMSQSKREIPHYYLVMDVDMSAAAAHRALIKRQMGQKVSYNHMILRACALALRDMPAVNVAWAGDKIIQRTDVNVGFAVALDDGLIVPVVRQADTKSMSRIAQEMAELVEKARAKRLTPDEYQGGSMTVSNLGMYEIDFFFPIVNPGESMILGVGQIKERVVAVAGGIHIRPIMTITLSADHRLVDGAVGAQFLRLVRDLLENPTQL